MSRFCRLNLLLDLDETLINGVSTKNASKLPSNIKKTLPNFTFQHDGREDRVIFARPHLQEFLTFCFQHFNVGVFTSASKEYAIQIVAKFILNSKFPERKLVCLLDRRHIADSNNEDYKGEKNLNYLYEKMKLFNFYPCNTILLDNSDKVLELNNVNSIRAPDFRIFLKKNNQYVLNEQCVNDEALLIIQQVLKDINKEWTSMSSCVKDTLYSGCYDNSMPIFTYQLLKIRDDYDESLLQEGTSEDENEEKILF